MFLNILLLKKKNIILIINKKYINVKHPEKNIVYQKEIFIGYQK